MTAAFDIESLPRHDGLCAECVDRHACPMVGALLEQEFCYEQRVDLPSFEGHTLVWCPMFG